MKNLKKTRIASISPQPLGASRALYRETKSCEFALNFERLIRKTPQGKIPTKTKRSENIHGYGESIHACKD